MRSSAEAARAAAASSNSCVLLVVASIPDSPAEATSLEFTSSLVALQATTLPKANRSDTSLKRWLIFMSEPTWRAKNRGKSVF